ncbi:MAG: putative sulfate exporter family transporter [Flavobacteriaceae bacterium]|nr:putative sulfate exporter family transporter [Flavobacteriaceae bacterium]
MQLKSYIHEDWLVNLLGLGTIFLLIFGFNIPVPADDWANWTEIVTNILSGENLMRFLQQFLYVYAVSILGFILMKKPVKDILIGFPAVYLLTVLALLMTGNRFMSALNLEVVIFSLIIGLALRNLFEIPSWLQKSLSTEFFVKIGLVLLGTSVIFGDILKAGGLGLAQALIVVILVWYFAYWVCKKMGIDKEMTMMLASAVSICGVSAAIATAGAIQGDSKKLSYTISLVLVIAIPMMLGMPYLASYMGLTPEVTGAWLGGTIDTSGAVVASGTLAGEVALKYSTIVKFSQNVLLGLAAFAISIYWTYTNQAKTDGIPEKPTLGIIWERFPKFILGFMVASLLFSFAFDNEIVTAVKGNIKNLRNLWFALAFVSIGLETKFSDLFKQDNRKPLYAFLIAQFFNILLTLGVAYMLFNA